jgi:hypothetical protein
MAYAVVFKGNYENIHNVLSKYDKRGPIRDYEEMMKVYRSYSPNKLAKKAKQLFPSSQKPMFKFTFVRDPLSHFISGLVEAHYRRIYYRDDRVFLRGHAVNANKAAYMLSALIANKNETAGNEVINEHLVEKEHFAIMSTVLWLWRPDFIGYLENFQSDWTHVNEATGLNMIYTQEIKHPTSDDPLGMKKALMHVLHTKPNYMRAVCRLLMIDYVCLNYPLPAPCAHMKPNAEDCDDINKTVAT